MKPVFRNENDLICEGLGGTKKGKLIRKLNLMIMEGRVLAVGGQLDC